MQRVGGIIQVQINGTVLSAKGDFTYNLGRPKRETVIGSDGVHGSKDMPQVAFIEGEITDRRDFDLDTVLLATDATVTIGLANGKTIVLSDAHYVGDGNVNTGEGNMDVRFEGATAEEIPA